MFMGCWYFPGSHIIKINVLTFKIDWSETWLLTRFTLSYETTKWKKAENSKCTFIQVYIFPSAFCRFWPWTITDLTNNRRHRNHGNDVSSWRSCGYNWNQFAVAPIAVDTFHLRRFISFRVNENYAIAHMDMQILLVSRRVFAHAQPCWHFSVSNVAYFKHEKVKKSSNFRLPYMAK